MPRPERLQILVDLRKQVRPRLSQKAAAAKLGLDSNQGRKTVGDWELGKYAPNEGNRRLPFIHYLWDALGLRRDPVEFEAVWQILVEEWEWEPISDKEWRSFTNIPRPGHETQQMSGGITLPVPEPKIVPDVRNFVGRKEELRAYTQHLTETGYAVITGPAGVGKTALAARLATQTATNERIFWHVCYLDYDMNAFIWELAEFLAWRGENEIWHMLHAALQSGAMPPATTLLDYLFRTLRGQEILLCFDDFHIIYNDAGQKGLLDRLRGAVESGEIKLIVTAQIPTDLGDGNVEPLIGLTYEDTCRLLNTQGVPLTDPISHQLYSTTEGNAELLILAIQSLQKITDQERLIQRLVKTEQVKQFLLEEVDKTLHDEERMVMYGVAALLGFPGTADAIEEVLNSASVRYTLTHLVNRYLLEEGLLEDLSDETYRQHAIVQAFYYQLLGRNEKKEMHLRAAEYYEHESDDIFQAALHYQHARDVERAAQLATTNLFHSLYRGRARPLRQLLEKFTKRQLSAELWGAILVNLGHIYEFLEEWKLAVQSYEQAFNHLSTLPQSPDVRQLQVDACRGAAIALRSRTPEEALPWLDKGLMLTDGLAPMLEADLLIQQGLVLIKIDNGPRTEVQIQKGLSLLDNLPVTPRTSLIQLLGLLNLGIYHYYQNNLDQVPKLWEQALEIARQTQDPFNQLSLQLNLAALYQTQEEWSKAEACYETALTMADKLGKSLESARLQSNLGVMHLDRGNQDAAVDHLNQGLKLARQIQQAEIIVTSLTYLGDLHLRSCKPDQAYIYLQEATELAEERMLSFQLPTIVTLWAEYYLQQEQPQEALRHAEKAVSDAQRYGVKMAEDPAQAMLNRIKSQLSI
ncbi:MAG: tetratricopeptide repeat protein [Chloroflexota bacterium]